MLGLWGVSHACLKSPGSWRTALKSAMRGQVALLTLVEGLWSPSVEISAICPRVLHYVARVLFYFPLGLLAGSRGFLGFCIASSSSSNCRWSTFDRNSSKSELP
ncbi:Uncharacterized protein Adt_06398 [Abeliophyllum distichum]|uniref:Secreted protein n=1 Tax=Abeliophyllum distichum TaxID=126358 RepID=A0ABD1V736_9LAMI